MVTLTQLKERLHEVLWDSDLLGTRCCLILGSTCWGVLLLWPGTLFTPGRTTYALMSQIANEEAWGVMFIVHSAFMTWALITRARDYVSWLFDPFLGCVLWTSATILCFTSHWQVGVPYAPPAAMSAEVALMIAAWWNLVRSRLT